MTTICRFFTWLALAVGLVMPAHARTDNALVSAWSGNRFARTSDHVPGAGDCGALIQAGGGAQFAITFGAVGNYPPTCTIAITNTDAERGKIIVNPDLGTFVLWPKQSVLIFNQGNAWQKVLQPDRWTLAASTTFYISPGGHDGNDCLGTGSGACRTIQGAMDKVCRLVDVAQQQLIIDAEPGTYRENVTLCDPVGAVSGGYRDSMLSVRGDIQAPGHHVMECGAKACWTGVHSQAGWRIEGWEMRGSSFAILSDAGSHIYAGNNRSAVSGPSAHDFAAVYGSLLEIVADIIILNDKATMVYLTGAGSRVIAVAGVLIYFEPTVAYSEALMSVQMNAVASITGVKYQGRTVQPADACLKVALGGGLDNGGSGTNGLPCSTGATVVSPGWLN